MSAGAVEGSGIRQTGSASLLLSQAKATGFLLHLPTLSVSCLILSQPAEPRKMRTDPRTPTSAPSLLINRVSVRLGTCKIADDPDPSRRSPDKETSGKASGKESSFLLVCWTLLALESETIPPIRGAGEGVELVMGTRLFTGWGRLAGQDGCWGAGELLLDFQAAPRSSY